MTPLPSKPSDPTPDTGYEVTLLPHARRDLLRLPPPLQDEALDALERNLEARADLAEPFEVDDRTYLRVPLVEGLEAIFRPLTDEEVRKRVVRGLIDDRPSRVYMVFALEPVHEQPARGRLQMTEYQRDSTEAWPTDEGLTR